MGGNQSKSIQESSFTTKAAYDFVYHNSTELNLKFDKDTKVSAEASNEGVTIDGVSGSNVTVTSNAKSKFVSIEEINIALDTVSNSNLDVGTKLDAITGMMNSMNQETLGIANNQQNESTTDTTFKLSTAVDNINKMIVSICFCSKASVTSKASNKKITIKNIIGGSNIKVEAIAEAEASLTTLVDIMGAQENTNELQQSMESSTFNDLSNEQSQEALDNLTDMVKSIGNNVEKIATKGIETAGDVAGQGIGMAKWIILAPIVGIVALIALIIVFRLFKGNNNALELKKLELELENKRLEQAQLQAQMHAQPQAQPHPQMESQIESEMESELESELE